MRQLDVRRLYYITHIDNLSSILTRGILSHDMVEAEGVRFTPIYDSNIVERRSSKHIHGKKLWYYANLYFQPRNAMMYRIVHQTDSKNLVIIGINKTVLDEREIFITDGNAASDTTQFYATSEGLKNLKQQWSIIQNDWWNNSDGSKRKMMSECLVPDRIKPGYIETVYVAKKEMIDAVQKIISDHNITVSTEPDMFFQPNSRRRIGDNVSVIDGDMFFSNLQTLTISVNLQGIMGKGLASRAKYQFPDVYVAYQDVCRSKRITATKPYLYKREGSLDEELADFSADLATPNAVKWFLLFATKRKWRENSRLEDIEGGLDWVRRNFEKQGIQSLAMPALGCGLGGLDWKEAGPLMCKYLHGIDIDVAIYLPRERSISPEYLTASHLLSS